MLAGIADCLAVKNLIEDIKADFQLSDTILGLLAGLSFTLFYVVVRFPLGWRIIKGAPGLWRSHCASGT